MKKTLLTSGLKRAKGSNEAMFNAQGQLNANSKNDLIQGIAELSRLANNHIIQTEETAATKEATRKQHRVMLQSAFDSKEELAALGETISQTLVQTGNRLGFARNLLTYQEVNQGEIPQFRVQMKNVTASMANGPVRTNSQLVRDQILYPQEFYITTRLFIEQKELVKTNQDLLEIKYQEAMENIIVCEDRTWKRGVDDLVGVDNPSYNIAGSFTPEVLSRMVTDLSNWGLSARTALLSTNLLTDMMSSPAWQGVFDPVSQQEILLTGRLGTVYGCNIVTDHYRVEQQRVLQQGELYVIADPSQHGGYTDRGGVESTPIDVSTENIPGKGWHLTELFSLVIANSRSVVKGRKIGR